MKIKIADPANPGQFIEVDVSPEVLAEAGVISPDQFTERFSAELKRRTGAEVQTKLAAHTTTLLEDESFKQQFMDKWGIKPVVEPNKADEDAALATRLEAAHGEWSTKELTPLQAKLDKANERLGGVMKKLLHGEIMQAAMEAGIKPELLKAGPGGSIAPLLAMVEPLLGYSEEHDSFFARDGDTYRFSAKPEGGTPYMGAGELLSGWAGEKDNEWAIDAQRQKGPNAGDPHSVQKGGVIRLSAAEASDHATYQAAQTRAAETGARVTVDGMPSIGG